MPAQCPRCGRFLKRDLVESLGAGPAPCPRCGMTLTAESFPAEAGVGDPAEEPAAHTSQEVAAAVSADPEPSGRDPLAGWDQAGGMAAGPGEREHEIVVALEPQEAVVAGVVGALLGALVSRRTVRGALLGAIVAILAGAAARAVRDAQQLR